MLWHILQSFNATSRTHRGSAVENTAEGLAVEKNYVAMESDNENDEGSEEERYTHGLGPGSCVRCLKSIGDVPNWDMLPPLLAGLLQ